MEKYCMASCTYVVHEDIMHARRLHACVHETRPRRQSGVYGTLEQDGWQLAAMLSLWRTEQLCCNALLKKGCCHNTLRGVRTPV